MWEHIFKGNMLFARQEALLRSYCIRLKQQQKIRRKNILTESLLALVTTKNILRALIKVNPKIRTQRLKTCGMRYRERNLILGFLSLPRVMPFKTCIRGVKAHL